MSDEPSYMPPIPLGDPVRATTVGRVYASANPEYAPGDWVLGLNALEDYSLVSRGGFTTKIDVTQVSSPSQFLSSLGAVGLTAYFGLLDVGRPEPGETVLVTGAAGAVGSVVGQIAKIKGCRTIGIAGGPVKCKAAPRGLRVRRGHRLPRQEFTGTRGRHRPRRAWRRQHHLRERRRWTFSMRDS